MNANPTIDELLRRAKTVSQRLYLLRSKAGLSEEKLARLSGLDPQTIVRYERGDITRARASTVAKLARALGVPPTAIDPDWAGKPPLPRPEQNGRSKHLAAAPPPRVEFEQLAREVRDLSALVASSLSEITTELGRQTKLLAGLQGAITALGPQVERNFFAASELIAEAVKSVATRSDQPPGEGIDEQRVD